MRIGGQSGDNGSFRRNRRAVLCWELAPDSPWLHLILPEEKAWLVLLAESSPGLSAWLQN